MIRKILRKQFKRNPKKLKRFQFLVCFKFFVFSEFNKDKKNEKKF